MVKKSTNGPSRSQRGKSGEAQASNVHRMPGAVRRRSAAEPVPVLFPNVATIVGKAARAAVAVDPDNHISHWNKAAVEVFGFSEDEVLGRNLQQVIQARDVHGNRLPTSHSALHEMIGIGEAPQSFELAVITATGKMLRVAVSVVVVLGPQRGEYALVYLMTPHHRRRRADEAIDRLLAQVNIPGVTVPGTTAPSGAEHRGSRQPPSLTRRQLEVLLLMAEGKNSDEIATELGISINTVRTHTQGILRTLSAANRLEAVSRALHERLI
ncbi:MAG: LuxR C-terminal-related transcriptional regulator [Thermoanaerobaculales bacterium]|nr:LuxR C-terminal-related transcriptional regulator [Thermoanaerobaculales bacterium]